MWDEWGAGVPLAVLWIDDCQVCLSNIQAPFLAQLCARASSKAHSLCRLFR